MLWNGRSLSSPRCQVWALPGTLVGSRGCACGFEKHLIFHRPIPEGIEVVRVLHGAPDLAGLFDEV